MGKAARKAASNATERFRERQAQIVKAAVPILNVNGVAGMMLADVAARLDLVPTAVFYYYKRKEDLAAACMHSGLERFHGMLDATERTPGSEGLQTFVRRYFELMARIEDGAAPPLPLFNEIRALNDTEVNEEYVRMFKRLRSLVDGAVATRLGRIDRNIRTHQLLTQILWADRWLKRYDTSEYPRLAERFFDILTRGYLDAQRSPTLPKVTTAKTGLAGSDQGTEKILRVATQQINTRGYKAASIDKIAASLSLTKGAVYHHYDTKEDLAAACFERSVDLILRARETGERDGKTAAERLVITLTLLMQHQIDVDVPVIRLSAFASMPKEQRRKIFRRFDRLTLSFASMIADGVADGSMRPIDPFVGANMMIGVLMAATEAQFWASDLTAKNVGKLYVRPVIFGILA